MVAAAVPVALPVMARARAVAQGAASEVVEGEAEVTAKAEVEMKGVVGQVKAVVAAAGEAVSPEGGCTFRRLRC
jgi:hypothetical protein